MDNFVKASATFAALAAALLAGVYCVWREMSIWTLAVRCLVVAALVYGFVRLGGGLAGRSLLRGIAEHQLKLEESENQTEPAEPSSAGERKAA